MTDIQDIDAALAAEFEYARQRELEGDMQKLGSERFHADINRKREGGNESATPAARTLMRRVLVPDDSERQGGEVSFVEAIIAFMDSGRGRPGRHHIAIKYLEQVEPIVAAFLTTKAILDQISQRSKLTQAAMHVATYIEDEVRFGSWREENKAFIDKMVRSMQERGGHYGHMKKVLRGYEERNGREWKPWPASDKLHLGMKLIDLFIEATGLVTRVDEYKHKNTEVYLAATEEALEWMKQRHDYLSLLSPYYLPTVIPPKPWDAPFGGGYHTEALNAKLAVVKSNNQNYLAELGIRDLSEVYSALNSMQETRWKVNADVFEVLSHLWRYTDGMGVLPSPNPLPLPNKPADIEENEEARTAWKRAAAKVHHDNRILLSKQLQVSRTLSVAERFKDEEAIYFPHCMDFRGRAYAIPLFLNPQGPDYAKALLTFSDGVPLGKDGAFWLAIHGANSFGEDKVPFNDRLKWVEEHTEEILACSEDPYENRLWTEADSPWQFLAFCFEWAGYKREGESFVSHLPVALDGSCNGLQHFSAMLLDEVGGSAVNLVPQEKPSDIYAAVAEAAIEVCEEESDPEKVKYARDWLESGLITRKVAKRPTMTLVYGATRFGMKDQVHEVVYEWAKTGVIDWENDGWGHSAYLGEVIWEALGRVVVKAREAMDFLQEAAKLAAKENLPINWTTPTGMPIQQAYMKTKATRVKTTLMGKQVFLTLNSFTKELDTRRQSQGVAPNWVHSLDASHLQRTVNMSVEAGITSFALVHDSYGTHAANAGRLGEILRDAFLQIHSEDVLGEFRERLMRQLSPENREKLPPLPAKGNLDIELVRQSRYFFA